MRNSKFPISNSQKKRGYTLIELIVAVGLFAFVMLLSSGAYIMMINLNRQAQAMATGINNLSFALESMTRDIRTGTAYSCGLSLGQGDCSGGGAFTFTPEGAPANTAVSYGLSGGSLQKTANSVQTMLTDPSVNILTLAFYVTGTPKGDGLQPHVTIIMSGTVSSGPGKTQPFTVETGATMRGSDL